MTEPKPPLTLRRAPPPPSKESAPSGVRRAPPPATRAPGNRAIPTGQANTAAQGANGTVRLNKRMAELGMASRREADDWIAKGWVKVNGQVAEMGLQVAPDARIEIDKAAKGQQTPTGQTGPPSWGRSRWALWAARPKTATSPPSS